MHGAMGELSSIRRQTETSSMFSMYVLQSGQQSFLYTLQYSPAE